MRSVVVSNPQPIRLSDLALQMRAVDRRLPQTETSCDLSRGGDSWVENEEFRKQRRQWQVEAHRAEKVGEGFSPVLF